MSSWSVPEPGERHDPYATVMKVLHELDAEMEETTPRSIPEEPT